jgi:hypothetical protein
MKMAVAFQRCSAIFHEDTQMIYAVPKKRDKDGWFNNFCRWNKT